MKKYFAKAIALIFIIAILFAQQGCVKDSCHKTYTYTYFVPLYKTVAEVRANIKSNAPKAIVSPGKIYLKGNYIFLNELNKGIHVIDNSNPSSPQNIAFIDLPGNVDIVAKDNTMYADFYEDLAVLDISNPLNITLIKIVDKVFPERNYYGYNVDKTKIIYDWVKKTEVVSYDCNTGYLTPFFGGGVLANAMDAGMGKSGPAASPVGISGSLARFTIINDYMYTVSQSTLNVINISQVANPVISNVVNIGFGIETIYPFKDKLFIGSSNGMFIYSVQNPASPLKEGTFTHARSCDPVIADDNFAFVTLHSGTTCQGFSNQLDVLNINNLQSPIFIKSYPLTSPRGLSKDGSLLFICDGKDGFKVFGAANVTAISLIKQFAIPEANDVIAFNNIALVIATDGLYQFDYSDTKNIKLISKIPVQN